MQQMTSQGHRDFSESVEIRHLGISQCSSGYDSYIPSVVSGGTSQWHVNSTACSSANKSQQEPVSVSISIYCSQCIAHSSNGNVRGDQLPSQKQAARLPFESDPSELQQPYSDAHRVIYSRKVQLMSYLNPRTLLPHLQRNYLLCPDDVDYVTNPCRTENEMRERILSRAPYMGENSLHKFICCLEEEHHHLAHKELAKELRLAERRIKALKQKKTSEQVEKPLPSTVTMDKVCDGEHLKEMIMRKRIQWLQTVLNSQDFEEVIELTTKTHSGTNRCILHSGYLLQDGEMRWVVVLSDFLLILRPVTGQQCELQLQWLTTDKLLANKPMLLDTLEIQAHSTERKFYISALSKTGQETTLEAGSQDALDFWRELLQAAVRCNQDISMRDPYSMLEPTPGITTQNLLVIVRQQNAFDYHCSTHRSEQNCELFIRITARYGESQSKCGSYQQLRNEWILEFPMQPGTSTSDLDLHFCHKNQFRPDDFVGLAKLSVADKKEAQVIDSTGKIIGSVLVTVQLISDTVV